MMSLRGPSAQSAQEELFERCDPKTMCLELRDGASLRLVQCHKHVGAIATQTGHMGREVAN